MTFSFMIIAFIYIKAKAVPSSEERISTVSEAELLVFYNSFKGTNRFHS